MPWKILIANHIITNINPDPIVTNKAPPLISNSHSTPHHVALQLSLWWEIDILVLQLYVRVCKWHPATGQPPKSDIFVWVKLSWKGNSPAVVTFYLCTCARTSFPDFEGVPPPVYCDATSTFNHIQTHKTPRPAAHADWLIPLHMWWLSRLQIYCTYVIIDILIG